MSYRRKYKLRGLSKVVWHAAYGLAVILPARNKRTKEARAHHFAAKVQKNTDRHSPMAVAVAVNSILIAIGGMVTVKTVQRDNSNAITATISDGFLSKNDAPAPPSGGSEASAQASLNAAASQMLASPAVSSDLSMVTTTATSKLNFQVTTHQASLSPAQGLSKALANMSTNSESGVGNGTKTGTDSTNTGGTGGGTGKGIGQGSWNMDKNAKGNIGEGWSRAGKDALKNQNIVLIYDQTQRFVGETQNYKGIEAIRDALISNNTLIGEYKIFSGMMGEKAHNDLPPKWKAAINDKSVEIYDTNGTTVPEYWNPTPNLVWKYGGKEIGKIDYMSAYWAIQAACKEYAGRKAIIIVLSDFCEGTNNTESVEALVKNLIQAELRLYLITTEEVPGRSGYIAARQSGGDVRKVFTKEYANIIDGNYPKELEWADPRSKNLIRDLDKPPGKIDPSPSEHN